MIEEKINNRVDLDILSPPFLLFTLGGYNGIEERKYKLFAPKLKHLGYQERIRQILYSKGENINESEIIEETKEIFSFLLGEDDKEYIYNALGVDDICKYLATNAKLLTMGFASLGMKQGKKKI